MSWLIRAQNPAWAKPLVDFASALTLALLVFAAVVALAFSAAALAFPYEIDYGEAPLIDQAVRLAAGETIYRSNLAAPPYTISNYPPLYIATLAVFVPWTGPAFWPGRLVTLLSTLSAALFIALIVQTTTRDRLAAVVAGLSLLAWPYVVLWLTLARIDLLALGLSLAGLWVLARWPRTGRGLWLGGLLLVAAIYSRQSYGLAAPAAACVWTWSVAGFRRAAQLGSWIAGLAGGLFIGLNWATGGGFYLNIVTANVNAFRIETVSEHAWSLWGLAGTLVTIGIASLAAIRRWNPLYALAAPYLIGATVSALTIGKIGSNVNYLLELCAALSIALGVMTATARRYLKAPAVQALMYGLLAVQVVGLLEATWTRLPGDVPGRFYRAAELAELEALVAGVDGPVLADEQMGMITLAGKRLALQPFEMTQLAIDGLWDQTPLLNEIRSGTYDLIILYDRPWLKDRWTPEMFAAIDQAYQLSAIVADNKVYQVQRVSIVGDPVTCPGAPWSLPTRAELGVRWDSGGLNLFGHGTENTIPVLAVAPGRLTVIAGRPDAVAVRSADPLEPGREVWVIIDGLADGSGALSYVAPETVSGGPIEAGARLGAQGRWSGQPTFPMWVHARITLIRATEASEPPSSWSDTDVLDPRPYFGLSLPDASEGAWSHRLECVNP